MDAATLQALTQFLTLLLVIRLVRVLDHPTRQGDSD